MTGRSGWTHTDPCIPAVYTVYLCSLVAKAGGSAAVPGNYSVRCRLSHGLDHLAPRLTLASSVRMCLVESHAVHDRVIGGSHKFVGHVRPVVKLDGGPTIQPRNGLR